MTKEKRKIVIPGETIVKGGEFLPGDDVACEFWADRFSPRFIGRGNHANEAYRDWRDQVHEVFQDLYGKRPFEMTEEESRDWCLLEDLIDVVDYRNETPIVIHQIGLVSQARPLPRRIRWLDGRSEPIGLEDAPGEFAGYKPGQPFEAEVQRDRRTGRLLRVLSTRRITSIHPLKSPELQEFWDGMPGTSGLPASERKWTES